MTPMGRGMQNFNAEDWRGGKSVACSFQIYTAPPPAVNNHSPLRAPKLKQMFSYGS